MTPAVNSIESILADAVEFASEADRRAYVERACAGDADLKRRVEELIDNHFRAGSFLEGPAPDLAATADQPVVDRPGTVIGPYKLLERIGEGGFGVVFLAEQQAPVRRKVALKILKPGMDTRQVVARFEAERQALALMDHPHIARVFDGGATPSGRPYFVMELVRGVPITDFCDQQHLTPRDRLGLFVQVCRAVQHAHQKGIIHRDLKPSNVLVSRHDSTPVVKVIDFGVAKALGQELTDKTLFTGLVQMVGTPLYMSPEQAGMSDLDVDTRSDIYSLGVLLYELLTGTTPFARERFQRAAYDEIRRIIREEDPPPPSTRLSQSKDALPSISAQRQTEPARLTKLVRGELDWIAMKALEKDRNRRYETAAGLAADVDRYLAGEPVLAVPPSAAYRLRKLAHKHRGILRAAAAFVAVLVLGAAVSTWQAVRATLAERRAVADRDRAEASFRMAREAVDRSFTQVSESSELKAQGLETFRRGLLQNAKDFYERFVREQPDVPAARYDLGVAHRRLAEIERELGNDAAAEDMATKAIAILSELAAAQPDADDYQRDLAASFVALALIYADGARWDKAEAAFAQALAIQEGQVRAHPESAEHRYTLARTYTASGVGRHRAEQWEPAAQRFRQALDVLGRVAPDRQPPTHQSLLAKTQMDLGQVCITRGWYDQAEAALTEAVRLHERLVRAPDAGPEDWQALAQSQAILGRVYNRTARAEKAEEAQQQALRIFEKLAHDHPDRREFGYHVGRCHFELAVTADQAGRLDAALARYDKAVEFMGDALARGYLAGRTAFLDARIQRAVALAKKGNHARAADEADALDRQEALNAMNTYNVACAFAQAAAAADRDAGLPPAERAQLRQRYADRAMDSLRRAVAKGYASPDAMKTDTDLDPIRGRDDFRKLAADLEARRKDAGMR